MSGPAALVVPAVKKHTATVIFAHGLGDSGAGWMPIAENWRRRGKFEHIKFIFPNAPSIPISVNSGMSMPGWYDITTFDDLQENAHDEVGIVRSRDYFSNLIKSEIKATGVPSSRMVLGGFSQGGAIALFTGITVKDKLAGIVGLSSYLLMGNKIKDLLPEGGPNVDVPIYMGHGDIDPMVKYTWGQRTAQVLRELGFKVDFKTYKGLQHSAAPEEIDDLESFIKSKLPAQEAPASMA